MVWNPKFGNISISYNLLLTTTTSVSKTNYGSIIVSTIVSTANLSATQKQQQLIKQMVQQMA